MVKEEWIKGGRERRSAMILGMHTRSSRQPERSDLGFPHEYGHYTKASSTAHVSSKFISLPPAAPALLILSTLLCRTLSSNKNRCGYTESQRVVQQNVNEDKRVVNNPRGRLRALPRQYTGFIGLGVGEDDGGAASRDAVRGREGEGSVAEVELEGMAPGGIENQIRRKSLGKPGCEVAIASEGVSSRVRLRGKLNRMDQLRLLLPSRLSREITGGSMGSLVVLLEFYEEVGGTYRRIKSTEQQQSRLGDGVPEVHIQHGNPVREELIWVIQDHRGAAKAS
ncbi:hypothetical protein C8J57DRAFT_1251940 [Mycena rebaudengoi]|nr:hypothetical protein C8J57DRAFT_1251940 [Mycena rebaudengoi]